MYLWGCIKQVFIYVALTPSLPHSIHPSLSSSLPPSLSPSIPPSLPHSLPTYIHQGFIQDFRFGGGDSTPRGVWGHVSPGKCQIMSILNGFWWDIPGLPPLYESLYLNLTHSLPPFLLHAGMTSTAPNRLCLS